MYEITIETSFSAAHRLRGYEGKCERLHGHNYRVEMALVGEQLNGIGLLMDFRDAKRLLGEVVGRLDHRCLNEMAPFDELNPTAEHIARYVCDEVTRSAPRGVSVARVTCWESEKCSATYRPAAAKAGDGPAAESEA